MGDFENLPDCFLRPRYSAAQIGGCTYREAAFSPEDRRLFDLPAWDQNANLRQWQDSRRDGDAHEDVPRALRPWDGQEEDEDPEDEETPAAFDETRQLWGLNLHVPRAFHRFVVGKNRHTLKQLETDFAAHIHVPAEDEEEELVLECPSREDLLALKAEIEALVEQQKNKMHYTHFVCIPLTDARLAERFKIFKSQLQTAHPDLDEALFAQAHRLHFTLLMLRLPGKEDEEQCQRLLESIGPAIYDALDTRSLVIHLKGLFIMNDDPTAAHVVYTTQYNGNDKDQETLNRLNRLCEVTIRAFRDAGVVSDEELHRQRLLDTQGENISVKLHATVLNATFQVRKAKCTRLPADDSQDPAAPEKRREAVRQARAGFDATEILREFRLFDFLNTKATCVSLCRLSGAEEPGGFYRSVASVRLP
ncbi:hypothetical protein BESB_037450 [Besnoitia besnoiti]|uniref:K Homology domain-containing protein n=1 Tax=Besnoitia besnoiti TaxID=94643 RepID=A0A2A9MN76_BESBE|nr:hypothetical protein BESB_037450 [Besnoitia besnoiti]PFH37287.1 hypothetical protein BESB_037450 [Besnoitia besnoiti]